MTAVTGPHLEDAMGAVLGACVALAGLLLIFSGFLFAQAALLDQDAANTSKAYIAGFRVTARWGMVPFSAALVLAIAALFYWLTPSECLARDVMFGFIILSVGAIAYGWWATRKL